MTNPIPGADAERPLPPLPSAKHIADGHYAYTADQMADYVRADRAAAKVGANVVADIQTWQERIKPHMPLSTENRSAMKSKFMAEEIADLRARLAAGAPAETPKPVSLVRACNAEYPIPNSPHASVIKRNEDNREAFGKGWLACTRANLAAQPAPAPSAPELILALPDYDQREIVIASDEMIDGKRVVCVAIEDTPIAGADVEKDAARYRWLRNADLDALAAANWGNGDVFIGDAFDAAIDAAMLAASSPAEAG